MFERFTQAARAAVNGAKDEAAISGDRRIGADHLLIALLHDPLIATALNTSARDARRAFAELDRRALVAVGVDLGDVEPGASAALSWHTPFTAGAKQTLARAVQTATIEKAHSIASRHLTLALLDRREPDPAGELLDALHVDRDAARELLAAPSQ